MYHNLSNNKSTMFRLDPRRQRDCIKDFMYSCVNANSNRSHVLVVKKRFILFSLKRRAADQISENIIYLWGGPHRDPRLFFCTPKII